MADIFFKKRANYVTFTRAQKLFEKSEDNIVNGLILSRGEFFDETKVVELFAC